MTEYRTRLDSRQWLPSAAPLPPAIWDPMMKLVKDGTWAKLDHPLTTAVCHACLLHYDRQTILMTGGFND
jgi:hypothetical protein